MAGSHTESNSLSGAAFAKANRLDRPLPLDLLQWWVYEATGQLQCAVRVAADEPKAEGTRLQSAQLLLMPRCGASDAANLLNTVLTSACEADGTATRLVHSTHAVAANAALEGAGFALRSTLLHMRLRLG